MTTFSDHLEYLRGITHSNVITPFTNHVDETTGDDTSDNNELRDVLDDTIHFLIDIARERDPENEGQPLSDVDYTDSDYLNDLAYVVQLLYEWDNGFGRYDWEDNNLLLYRLINRITNTPQDSYHDIEALRMVSRALYSILDISNPEDEADIDEADIESDDETDDETDDESDGESDDETDIESDDETDIESDDETDGETDDSMTPFLEHLNYLEELTNTHVITPFTNHVDETTGDDTSDNNELRDVLDNTIRFFIDIARGRDPQNEEQPLNNVDYTDSDYLNDLDYVIHILYEWDNGFGRYDWEVTNLILYRLVMNLQYEDYDNHTLRIVTQAIYRYFDTYQNVASDDASEVSDEVSDDEISDDEISDDETDDETESALIRMSSNVNYMNVPEPLAPGETAPTVQRPSYEMETQLDELTDLYHTDVENGLKEDDDAPFRIELLAILEEDRDRFMELKELILTTIAEYQQRVASNVAQETDMAEEQIRLLKDLDYQMTVMLENESQDGGSK